MISGRSGRRHGNNRENGEGKGVDLCRRVDHRAVYTFREHNKEADAGR